MNFAYLYNIIKYDIIDITGGDKMGKTSTQSKNKYNTKTYDQLRIIVKKGQKNVIKQYAESKGMSLNGYINSLIEADMKQGK